MKNNRYRAIIILFVCTSLLLCSCGKNADDVTSTEAVTDATAEATTKTSIKPTTEKTTAEETTTEAVFTTVADEEEQYSIALEEFNNGLKESGMDFASKYYLDLNNDGLDDIIYWYIWRPFVVLYENGKFVETDVFDDIIFGSSARNCLYYDESEKVAILTTRGTTSGTSLFYAAQAYQFGGSSPEALWIINTNPENYEDAYDDRGVVKQEAVDKAYADFQKMFNENTKGYNLVNVFGTE